MSKKHFKALAAEIASVQDKVIRDHMTQAIGQVCHRLNDRFDWSRWTDACNSLPYKG